VATGYAAPIDVATTAPVPLSVPESTVLATAPAELRPEETPKTAEALIEQPTPRAAPAAEPATAGGARAKRRWALLSAAAAVVAAAVVAAVVALGSGSTKHVSTKHVFTKGAIYVGNAPDGIVAGLRYVWVANAGDGSVTKLDKGSGRVIRTIPFANHSVGASPATILNDIVWVADGSDGEVFPINTLSDTVGRGISVGGHPSALVHAAGYVWVATNNNNRVVRIDPVKEALVPGWFQVGPDPIRMGVSKDSVWVANAGDGTVTRIIANPPLAEPPIRVGDHPHGITFVPVPGGEIWVANPDNNTVTRFSAASGKMLGSIQVGSDPRRIAVGQDSVFVANAGDGTVTQINFQGQVLHTIHVGGHPDAITAVAGVAWVDSWNQPTVRYHGAPGSVTRIEELTGNILAAPTKR
jgi:serine/threonine-protein kinase